ncbi:uncharacterized protein N0V89_002985 [Didymosphaeria variabile]|uniref:G-protein coupled receptors family 1 profile domain-containing protein n=1 Tax=Didymosphaeria variabile TaxID=1932322 RepID=A0A9W9CF44_9PLEO|nr:uncharacterized protein N0V89_002985 [Didymosphaeria variabile]KAJ4358403.1 hypothetical protein N0V89_002985 [Didymosphaeria variabile]
MEDPRAVLAKRYFAYPNSLDPMTPTFKKGLIPLVIFAMASLVSVFALLCFITWRLIGWRKSYREYVGGNQYILLIFNLLIADFQQSIAFVITFHWLKLQKILAPTAPCFVQAWFLHLGDVASGFFVLAIAVHTWLGVVKGYRMRYGWLVVLIVGIWALAVLLTVLGPAMHGNRFFARAGGWCWVSVDFEPERLWLHYLWIFIVEFGTMAIYGHIFFHLKGRLRSIINNDTSKLSRATKFMILYPAVYVFLTMPLAIGRMVSMAGVTLPDTFFCIAGSFLTSCGWVDALLYTLTRRVFVNSDVSGHAYNRTTNTGGNINVARAGDDYGLHTINKEVGRTVTIVGGTNRLSRMVDKKRRGHGLTEHSASGSQDSIIKPIAGTNGIAIVTETNIQVESASARDSDETQRQVSEGDLGKHAQP